MDCLLRRRTADGFLHHIDEFEQSLRVHAPRPIFFGAPDSSSTRQETVASGCLGSPGARRLKNAGRLSSFRLRRFQPGARCSTRQPRLGSSRTRGAAPGPPATPQRSSRRTLITWHACCVDEHRRVRLTSKRFIPFTGTARSPRPPDAKRAAAIGHRRADRSRIPAASASRSRAEPWTTSPSTKLGSARRASTCPLYTSKSVVLTENPLRA